MEHAPKPIYDGKLIDAKEKDDREKRKNIIVINGIPEEDSKNARALTLKVQELLTTRLDMTEVPIEGAHRVGLNKADSKHPNLIVCTIMDARKRRIIIDNSSTYLRGTDVYINEDRTLMQQKEIRKKVAERKAKMAKQKSQTKKVNEQDNE